MAAKKITFQRQAPLVGLEGQKDKFKCNDCTDNVIYEEGDLQPHVTTTHPGHFWIVDTADTGW